MTTTQPGSFAPAAHMEPVPDEIDAVDLPVTGALPPELTGRYFRNSSNPLPGDRRPHWFTGHGMLHGVRLSGGQARWYRNRWVRTATLAGENAVGPDGERDLAVNPANTHVIEHSGRLLALCEAGLPYEVDRHLETVGPVDFDGRLNTAMTAHPKLDPITGELHFFGYGFTPPYLTYHVLSPDGQLRHSAPVDVPGPTMMHDFAITEHYVLWLDLPIVFDHTLIRKTMPYVWNDDYGARVGVMRKSDGFVRWFEVDPCYVFHVGNASEDSTGRVVLDAIRYSERAWHTVWSSIGGRVADSPAAGPRLAEAAASLNVCALHRWTFDLTTGDVHERLLDDRGVEFPTINEDRLGLPSRYVYTVAYGDDGAVLKYDTRDGNVATYELTDEVAGEAVFIPATDTKPGDPHAEDAGWLMSVLTTKTGSGSRLVVFDATAVANGPIASVELPRRVPAGFHGSWIPDSAIPDSAIPDTDV